jgi:hypothetical protein
MMSDGFAPVSAFHIVVVAPRAYPADNVGAHGCDGGKGLCCSAHDS